MSRPQKAFVTGVVVGTEKPDLDDVVASFVTSLVFPDVDFEAHRRQRLDAIADLFGLPVLLGGD